MFEKCAELIGDTCSIGDIVLLGILIILPFVIAICGLLVVCRCILEIMRKIRSRKTLQCIAWIVLTLLILYGTFVLALGPVLILALIVSP